MEDLNEAGKRLMSFIERIERINQDIDDLKLDVKEVYAESASVGFDVKIIREIVKLRKKDKNKRDEEKALLETYLAAIGEA
jgi:uncharacterized protein (UPF0335 family)